MGKGIKYEKPIYNESQIKAEDSTKTRKKQYQGIQGKTLYQGVDNQLY